jgi:hypothetical protein
MWDNFVGEVTMYKGAIMSNKIEISQKIEELSQHENNRVSALKSLQSQFENEVLETAKGMKPKIKKMNLSDANEIVSMEVQQKILAPYKEKADKLNQELDITIKQLEDELTSLCDNYKFPDDMGDTWSLYRSSSTYIYATQAWGAKSYARGALQSSLQHLVSLGLDTEVKWISNGCDPHWGIESGTYELWVRGDSTDVEIAKWKPGMTLEQTIKAMEKIGVNPRVYYPFLPYND